ncbi:MAG TPA: CoA ester lyase [Thermomicrobiales bacterium]|nr:CoA ester lyase [Thermomicrobiales bacterium]
MNVDRAERSVLATPGSNPRMIAKALASDADLVMIDLEDAVAPDAKAAARATVAEALREGDWQGRPRTFRMNALDTPWFVHDLTEVIDGARGQIDLVVAPKVARAEDVHVVATILASLEVAAEAKHPIGLETQIESAAGLAHCEAIAVASPRVEALVFGPGDYAASIRMPLAAIGMPDRWDTDYPGHRWDYPLQRILVAARAAGVRAIDGPYADFRDRDGFRRSCLAARALGYDGKWCIHPDQVPIANEIFSADEAELTWAREILVANAEAEQAGRGSFAFNGQMVDAATLRMARATLARASRDRN